MNAKDEVREGEFREGDECEALATELAFWKRCGAKDVGKRGTIAGFCMGQDDGANSAAVPCAYWVDAPGRPQFIWPLSALRRVSAAKGEEKEYVPQVGDVVMHTATRGVHFRVTAVTDLRSANGVEMVVCAHPETSWDMGNVTTCDYHNLRFISREPERSETREPSESKALSSELLAIPSESAALATNLRRLAGTERTATDERMYREMMERRGLEEVKRAERVRDAETLESMENEMADPFGWASEESYLKLVRG